jgi:hypothetical protein
MFIAFFGRIFLSREHAQAIKKRLLGDRISGQRQIENEAK